MFIGIACGLDCAADGDFLFAAVWSLVAAIGWHELRQTRDFNESE